jgi:hypothetical protein
MPISERTNSPQQTFYGLEPFKNEQGQALRRRQVQQGFRAASCAPAKQSAPASADAPCKGGCTARSSNNALVILKRVLNWYASCLLQPYNQGKFDTRLD